LFQELRLPEPTLQSILERLLREEESKLAARHTGYGSAHAPFSHTLSGEAVDAMMDADREGKYYTVSQYFKAVIEDYCRQSPSRREELYFADFFATLRGAIANQQQLDICNRKNVRYQVHPYKILTDPNGSCHYLVCYARTKKQPIHKKAPFSFRISHLSAVRSTGAQAFLSEKERTVLEDALQNQGVQFLMSSCETVKVKLTPKGIQKLNRHATLRPLQECPPVGNVYTFRCTETQAEYYFLKLGDDAEILEPARLRDRFAKLHTRAAAAYAGNDSAASSCKGNGKPADFPENTEKTE